VAITASNTSITRMGLTRRFPVAVCGLSGSSIQRSKPSRSRSVLFAAWKLLKRSITAEMSAPCFMGQRTNVALT
jgi:hypothetical protein